MFIDELIKHDMRRQFTAMIHGRREIIFKLIPM